LVGKSSVAVKQNEEAANPADVAVHVQKPQVSVLKWRVLSVDTLAEEKVL